MAGGDDNAEWGTGPFPPFKSLTSSEKLAAGIGDSFPPFTASEKLAGFAADIPVAEIQRAVLGSGEGRFGDLADSIPALKLAAAASFGDIERIHEAIRPSLDALNGMSAISLGIAEQMRIDDHRRAALDAFAMVNYVDGRDDLLKPAAGTFDEIYSPPTVDFPKIRNPIEDTNDLLAEQREEISRLANLAAQQIEVQTKQVELITSLLTAFVESASTQEQSNREAHEIARRSLAATRRSMWIAVIALLFPVLLAIGTAI